MATETSWHGYETKLSSRHLDVIIITSLSPYVSAYSEIRCHSVSGGKCPNSTPCMFLNLNHKYTYTDIAKFAGHLPHRYGNSRAIWDHTVLQVSKIPVLSGPQALTSS